MFSTLPHANRDNLSCMAVTIVDHTNQNKSLFEDPLLDKVGCTVIENVQKCEHHLMLKSSRGGHMVMNRRCVWNKIFLFGSTVWNHNVSLSSSNSRDHDKVNNAEQLFLF